MKSGTFDYYRVHMWLNINKRTINGTNPQPKCKNNAKYLAKGIRVEFTKQDFYAWMHTQREVVENLIAQGEIPSIDRLSTHYELGKLEIVSLAENAKRANSRAVMGTNVKTGEVVIFRSTGEAGRSGFTQSAVSQCASKKPGWATHKGYRWDYIQEDRNNAK